MHGQVARDSRPDLCLAGGDQALLQSGDFQIAAEVGER